MGGDSIPYKHIDPRLVKWWGKYHFTTGEITHMWAPSQLRVMGPLFEDPWGKALRRVKGAKWAIITGSIYYCIYRGAKYLQEQDDRSHWP